MAASYPGTIKTFSTKVPGEKIASSHINELQDEVVAIETQLGTYAGTWQSWTPTVTGWAAGYICRARYCTIGKLCIAYIYIVGASSATNAELTLPLPASITPLQNYVQVPVYTNGGVTDTVGGQCFAAISAGTNKVLFWLDGSLNGWALSGDKFVQTTIIYEVA